MIFFFFFFFFLLFFGSWTSRGKDLKLLRKKFLYMAGTDKYGDAISLEVPAFHTNSSIT